MNCKRSTFRWKDFHLPAVWRLDGDELPWMLLALMLPSHGRFDLGELSGLILLNYHFFSILCARFCLSVGVMCLCVSARASVCVCARAILH